MNEERLWAILDEIREDVKDLCVRQSVTEEKIDNHLKHQESKFNKTTVIMGIVVAIIAIMAALK